FLSSRRRHTRSKRDWSSDVCSSDLVEIYNTPKTTWAFLGGLDWKLKFRAPVRAADTLRARVTVKDKRLWIKPDRGAVTLFNEILDRKSVVVCTVEVIVLLATRAEGTSPGAR